MDLSWEDIRLFVAVSDEGSLSGAARKLQIGQPTVSRRLAQLERSLGARLFERSKEGAQLTSAGARLLPPARRMAEWAGECGRAAERRRGAMAGLVRLTAPPFVCGDFLAPFAAWIQRKHPQVRLEVNSAIRYVDLARGEADLALRIQRPTQPDLTTLYTRRSDNAVFVARSLARKLRGAKALQDLPWIGWAPPYEMLPPNPQLAGLGIEPSFTSDQMLVNLAAAEAGAGALVLPSRPHRFSKGRKLVPLALDLGPHTNSEIHLVCAKSVMDIPRIRLIAHALIDELKWRPN